MATGKSAVGRKLARRLRRPFVDLDRVIEESEGMRVSEIFARRGEAYFREAERRALAEVLSRDGQVIATGGGAVMDPGNLALLRERSVLVCLTASPEVLLRRLGKAEDRPLLSGPDRESRMAELLKQREDAYRRAELCVDTSDLTVDEVVAEIVRCLEGKR